MDKLWKQITTSNFAWEQEALEFAKSILPDHDPYRAWANFEFIAQDGSINEVDLLVLTSKGMYLVEIKSHPGQISGDSGSWVWDSPNGRRKAFDNPRFLADRKAKKLASLLQVQRSVLASKERLPFIGALVFLSAQDLIVKLAPPANLNVATRDTLLRDITEVDENWRHPKIQNNTAKTVSRAIEEAGIKESQRIKRVGQYQLTSLLGEDDHFQDWLATHSDLNVTRKVRIYLTYGKRPEEAQRLEKAAKLEFRLLEGIEHPGILKAKDYQAHDHGPALVYEYDPDAHRLDHLLMSLEEGRRLTTAHSIMLLRLIAETVRYAHGQKLYHRALSPQSIYVKEITSDKYSIKIGNWSTAERVYETETQQISAFSHLSRLVQEEAGPYVAIKTITGEAIDGVHMDVFSLGTIAYHLFTGKKPANDDLELQDKLRRGNGLQITDELNGTNQSIQYLVQYATHPDIMQRLDSVDEFLQWLDKAESELARPESQRTSDPTDARENDIFDGGITVKKRLGKGACSVVFLVDIYGQERVLKMAITPDHNQRLHQEGEVLSKLRHQAIVAYHKIIDVVGHTCLVLDNATEGTLAKRLRSNGAEQLELLERFGDDLLSAMVHLEEKAFLHRDIKPENIGMVMQGSQLHLMLFDFSLSNVSADNIVAGTVAYMDPYLRDQGRRRWDHFAERFSAALTLYEMAAGTLPGWASGDSQTLTMEGELQIDRKVFDPAVRDRMAAFFKKSLVRDVRERFANAEEMLRSWRQIFSEASNFSKHPTVLDSQHTCPVEDAQLDTQIGLLSLSVQALDTLTRRGINTVADLIKLNRSHVRVWIGVGSKTRAELSDVIGQLQERLLSEQQARQIIQGEISHASIDRIFDSIFTKQLQVSDAARYKFLSEYLGRLDSESPTSIDVVHWPSPIQVSGSLNIETTEIRAMQEKSTALWDRNKSIKELREEIFTLLRDNGGVMTAIEISETVLLRRGSVHESPLRQRKAQAVVRAAIETELSKKDARWILRRNGNSIVIADNSEELGHELAEYAEALGQLAEECARQEVLLAPIRALEKIRAVPAPESFAGLSTHRLLRLAAAASQNAALSSRAEFYPKGMNPKQALELAQGALLGSKALSVNEVQSRVAGRYPAAMPLPGRPELDSLIASLQMGFAWDDSYEPPADQSGLVKQKGAYCLPISNPTSLASMTKTYTHYTQLGEGEASAQDDIKYLTHEIEAAIKTARFLALTVKPKQMQQATEKLCGDYSLTRISFDEILLRHMHNYCDSLKSPPDWSVVLRADAADRNSIDWQRLQYIVQQVLPAITEEIKAVGKPVLITEPGLIARYDLVSTWLNELRQYLVESPSAHGIIILIAADAQSSAAAIDNHIIPKGAGSNEFARIPSVWLEQQPAAFNSPMANKHN